MAGTYVSERKPRYVSSVRVLSSFSIDFFLGRTRCADQSMKAKAITAETNRGMLLDIVVFIINLTLMNLLTQYSLDLFRLAEEGDAFAELALLLCSGGMFILPAAGAVMKRWHFHRRLSARSKPKGDAATLPFDPLDLKSNVVAGCLFNPIFYFVLSI